MEEQAPFWAPWGPEGWGPEGWGAQNFALFFPLPPPFRSFCVYPGVCSWNFGGVGSAGTLKCARLEFSGCRVRAPAARSGGAAGVSHDSPRAQTTKIQRGDTQRDTKRAKWWREREKIAKFCAVRRREVQWRGGPAEGGPGKSKPATTTTTTTTTTPNPEQVGPARSPKKGLGSLGVGHNNTQHQHTTTQNNNNT